MNSDTGASRVGFNGSTNLSIAMIAAAKTSEAARYIAVSLRTRRSSLGADLRNSFANCHGAPKVPIAAANASGKSAPARIRS